MANSQTRQFSLQETAAALTGLGLVFYFVTWRSAFGNWLALLALGIAACAAGHVRKNDTARIVSATFVFFLLFVLGLDYSGRIHRTGTSRLDLDVKVVNEIDGRPVHDATVAVELFEHRFGRDGENVTDRRGQAVLPQLNLEFS